MEAGTLKRAIVASFPALLPAAKSVLFKLFKGKELAHPTQVAGGSQHRPRRRRACGRRQLSEARRSTPMNDVAVLQYTGGTTGTPKGRHAHACQRLDQLPAGRRLGDQPRGAGEERALAALPFFHVFAMTAVMNFALQEGAEIVIMPRFVLDDAMKLIDKTKPTVMPGVPTMFIAMLNHPKLASFDLSSLKYCVSGGAPLPVDVKEKFETADGLQGGRGLRPLRGQPQRHLQSRRGAGESGLHRPAAARHHRVAARPCRPGQGGAAGREGRDLRQGPAGDEGLLEAARGDRQPVRGRLPAHGRCRHHGRRRASSSSSTASRTSSSARATMSIRAASRRRSTSIRRSRR